MNLWLFKEIDFMRVLTVKICREVNLPPSKDFHSENSYKINSFK